MDSKIGEGSKFTFILPFGKQPDPGSSTAQSIVHRTVSMSSMSDRNKNPIDGFIEAMVNTASPPILQQRTLSRDRSMESEASDSRDQDRDLNDMTPQPPPPQPPPQSQSQPEPEPPFNGELRVGPSPDPVENPVALKNSPSIVLPDAHVPANTATSSKASEHDDSALVPVLPGSAPEAIPRTQESDIPPPSQPKRRAPIPADAVSLRILIVEVCLSNQSKHSKG